MENGLNVMRAFLDSRKEFLHTAPPDQLTRQISGVVFAAPRTVAKNSHSDLSPRGKNWRLVPQLIAANLVPPRSSSLSPESRGDAGDASDTY